MNNSWRQQQQRQQQQQQHYNSVSSVSSSLSSSTASTAVVTAAATTSSSTARATSYLHQFGFSSGLSVAFHTETTRNCPLRIWLLDNSVYMNVKDAHIYNQHQSSGTKTNTSHSVSSYSSNNSSISSSGRRHSVASDVTRWEELCDCVAYHTQLALHFGLPMRFALLNPPITLGLPQYFGLNQHLYNPKNQHSPAPINSDIQQQQQEVDIIRRVMSNIRLDSAPQVPLTKELQRLRDYIGSFANQLRISKQSVSIIIATQGLPTATMDAVRWDQKHAFIAMVRSFETLPVSFVFRLTTDDEATFEFYNALDRMETRNTITVDVLDDHVGEAMEVYLHNPWLTYGLALHRFREMGFRIPVLDVLDERSLTTVEVGSLCYLLFATTRPLPNPETQWPDFVRGIQQLLSQEAGQYNPITKRTSAPWINLEILESCYSPARYSVQPALYDPYYHHNQQTQQTQQQQQQIPPPQHAYYPQQQQHGSCPPSQQCPAFQQQPPPPLSQRTTPVPNPNPYQVPSQNQHQHQYPSSSQQQQQQQQQHYQSPLHQLRPNPPPPPQYRPPTATPPLPPHTYQQPGNSTTTTGISTSIRGQQQQQVIYDLSTLKKVIYTQWALQPPTLATTKPLPELFGSMATTFGWVQPHPYFTHHYHPLSHEALTSGDPKLLKRAVRKMKFFLHPDKLPPDLTEQQALLCRTLWDVITEAWDAHTK